jgi:hypothetical protein
MHQEQLDYTLPSVPTNKLIDHVIVDQHQKRDHGPVPLLLELERLLLQLLQQNNLPRRVNHLQEDLAQPKHLQPLLPLLPPLRLLLPLLHLTGDRLL